ncbi:hypothetical protein BDV25DRAFT_137131 [Aspergillus avenaceus]|uniref:Invertebrate defensins family profile domain-containing protein n=1 Tax=Aspergillus avenaceus TaxID=36643 RepID=A0A5N6U3Q7_ASPAV|nr:hypothetical protein BDV25DRAFT_137131 [Aspergillus avenaceus]
MKLLLLSVLLTMLSLPNVLATPMPDEISPIESNRTEFDLEPNAKCDGHCLRHWCHCHNPRRFCRCGSWAPGPCTCG